MRKNSNCLLAILSLLTMLAANPHSSAALPQGESLDPAQVATLFTAVNGTVEKAEADGATVFRWQINAGQTSQLVLRPDSPVFSRLRYCDGLEFEYRVASGEINSMDLEALGQVSGAYQSKVHQWHMAVRTAPAAGWQSSQIDLSRPAWYPWDNPDGEGGDFFRLNCLGLAPDTVVELRAFRFSRALLRLKPDFELPITWPVLTRNADGSARYRARYMVLNASGRPSGIEGAILSKHRRFQVGLRNAEETDAAGAPRATVPLKANQVATFEMTAIISAADIRSAPELYEEPLELAFAIAGDKDSACRWNGYLVRPLSPDIRRQVVVAQKDLDKIRAKVSAGDAEIRRLIDFEKLIRKADGFVDERLLHIPVSYRHPGASALAGWNPGDAMPEVTNKKTGEHEFGTDLASTVWKEYLGEEGKAVERLGLAYLYTGDEKYAAKAVELFGLYARQYGEQMWGSGNNSIPWERSPVTLAGSRVARSSSYGSNWLFKRHCRLAAMIADSPSWSPEKRREAYLGFALPYATEVMKFPGSINNMTDISNHNILLLGIVFDDPVMVNWALKRGSGLLARLGDFDSDGFSSEGRPLNYYLAEMAEYLPSITYLLNSGLKIDFSRDNLLAAFRMPFRRAALSGMVPSTGDCGRGQRAGPSGFADQFATIFPRAEWLHKAGLTHLAGRTPEQNAWRELLDPNPTLFSEAGMAILRSGATADSQVMATLDYGRNIIHAALDRNQITFLAFGKVFTHGPGSSYNVGTGGYTPSNDPHLRAFISQGSLGQNVVLVDKKDQLPAVGQLLAWCPEPQRQVVVSHVDGIAPGVSHIRALVLVRGVLVVLDRLVSGQPHTCDFAYHNFGELASGEGWKASPATVPLGSTANYDHIRDLQVLRGNDSLRLEWDLSNQTPPQANPKAATGAPATLKLSLWQRQALGDEIYTGVTGLNNPNNATMPDRAPSLFHRVKGKTAEFATVLEPRKGGAAIQSVEFPGGASAKLRWKDGTEAELALDELMN